jgi:hypothetical protein
VCDGKKAGMDAIMYGYSIHAAASHFRMYHVWPLIYSIGQAWPNSNLGGSSCMHAVEVLMLKSIIPSIML